MPASDIVTPPASNSFRPYFKVRAQARRCAAWRRWLFWVTPSASLDSAHSISAISRRTIQIENSVHIPGTSS
jgi:hypothetical protein